MDYKLPSSGKEDKMYVDNLRLLENFDWVKLVISDRLDYERAKEVVREYLLRLKANVAFSPVWGKLDPKVLVEWMLSDKLFRASLSLQLHKVIWPECVNSNIER